MAKNNNKIDAKKLADLEKKKKVIEKKKKIDQKQKEKDKLRAEQEALMRTQHKIIESTQMSIPIKDIHRGVVVTKDDRFLKLLEFKAQNFLMLSVEDRNRIADQFYQALRVAPAKIQFKVFSRKADVESLIETTAKCYENEQDEMCRRMQKEYIDLITNTALREGVTRRFLVVLEFENNINSSVEDFDSIVASLNESAAYIKSCISSAGNDFVPSCETDAGITQLYYEILNRKASETEPFSDRVSKVYDKYTKHYEENNLAELPPIPASEFIAPRWMDFNHAKYIVIDDKFYTFGYIPCDGYHSTGRAYAGWLSQIINASEGIDVDIFMQKIPSYKMEQKIGMVVRNNRAKFKETSDTSTEAGSIADIVASGMYFLDGMRNEDFFYTNVLITVTADTLELLEYRYNALQKMMQSSGLGLKRTFFQMEEAFLSSLPLCRISKDLFRKSKRNMLTNGACSFYPFISYELRDPNGIMLGVNSGNNSLVSVDVFDTSRHSNANGAIFGASGFGKTFTAQLLAIRMRLQNIQTFIITPLKGVEDYKRACDQISGQFVQLGPGSPYSINIMDIRVADNTDLDAIQGQSIQTSYLAQKVQSLHTFMHLIVDGLTQEEEQLLDRYIYKTYENFGITEDNESIFIPGTKEYKEFPLLGDLHAEIKNEPVLRRVANVMYPIIEGSLSAYNQHTNVDLDNKYIVFDMNGLKGQTLVISMFIVLDFVWTKIKENRLNKKVVFIDEAWQLISSERNEMAAEYVKEIFKTIRAYGGSAFVMTQEINDFFALKNGEYGKAILGNSDTKICLHLPRQETERLKEIMNVTPAEIKRIETLNRGFGMISTGNTKLFVDFKASPFEKDVITTDPQYLRAKLEQIKQKEQGLSTN